MDADYALLQSLYPLLDIRPLSSQEEEFFYQYMRGASFDAAAQAAGMTVDAARKLARSERGEAILKYLHEKTMTTVRVTKDLMTTLLLEAHRKAATVTEEIMAIRELGKLHDVYEEVKNNRAKSSGVNVLINQQNNILNVKQVQRLSDAELMELAGPAFQGFTLEPVPEAPKPLSQLDPEYDPSLDV